MLVRLGFQGTMLLWFWIRRLGDLRLMIYMQRFKTVSNGLIQRLKETNAADILNQVNKVAKNLLWLFIFLSSAPVKDCIPVGIFQRQVHQNSSFYRLLNINYFIQVNTKEYLHRNNILTTEHDDSEASDGL